LLKSDPSLAPRLFAGFEAAKAQFLKELNSAGEPTAEAQVLAKRRNVVGDDPLPNGLARNRKALEAIIRFAHEQKILPRPVKPEEMFAANTLELG
jgi:4,5-dihydroxyphthalate decarboxylase